MRGSRNEKDEMAQKLKNKLLQDIKLNLNELDNLKSNKSKKVKSSLLIISFLKSKFIPFFKNKIHEKNMLKINHSLLGLHHRKRYLKTTDLKKRSILLIQKHLRRILNGKKLKKMQFSAVQIQV